MNEKNFYDSGDVRIRRIRCKEHSWWRFVVQLLIPKACVCEQGVSEESKP